MVVTRPNMPNALAQKNEKLLTVSRRAKLKSLRRMPRRKGRNLSFPIGFEAQESAMKGVGFKKKLVIDLQRPGRRKMFKNEIEPKVLAIGKFLQHGCGVPELWRKGMAIEDDLQMRSGIGRYVVITRIKMHDVLQIAERNVQSTDEPAGIERQTKIALARFMSVRANGGKKANQRNESANPFSTRKHGEFRDAITYTHRARRMSC